FFGEFLDSARIESTRTGRGHSDTEFVAPVLVNSSVYVCDDTLVHPCITDLEHLKVHSIDRFSLTVSMRISNPIWRTSQAFLFGIGLLDFRHRKSSSLKRG